jgi:uncharacterized protein (TIGR02996 family)
MMERGHIHPVPGRSIMSSHPDADAFMRGYLPNPTDVTARLVFADWLEETGKPWNKAWAYYIRVKAEAERHPRGSPERWGLENQAVGYSHRIRARLTIPAGLFVGYPRSLLQLLPGPNITVRLDGHEVPPHVLELVPESVARENVALPLDRQGPSLLIVTGEPENGETLQKLEFMLLKHIVAVRGELDQVLAAINHHYGQTETESVDCVLYESPLIGLEGDGDSGALFSLFHTAFSHHTSGFEMELTATDCRVRYLRRDGTAFEEATPATVYHRLLDHLLSLDVERSRTERGLRCADVQVPLLSGRPFPVTVEREPAWRPREWFRLRFRW